MLSLAATFALALTFPTAVTAPGSPLPGVVDALVHDASADVRRAGAIALGRITDATATQALTALAGDQSPAVARMALTSLGDQQTEAAAEALFHLQQDDRLGFDRRQAAADTLRARYARLRERFPPVEPPSRAGLAPAVLVSGEVGALGLTALGFLGRNPTLGAQLGGWSGAALGLSSGYLLNRDEPLSAVRGWRYVSYTNWGVAGGITLASGWLRQYGSRGYTGDRRISTSAAALGSLGGYAAAALDRNEISLTEQAFVDVSGFAGLAIGRAAALWMNDTHLLRSAALGDAGALTGLFVSRRLVHRFRLSTGDQMLLVSAPALASWMSLWSVLTVDPNPPGDRLGAWTLAAAGGGWFAGLALASAVEVPSDTIFTADVTALYGAALGFGTSLVATPRRNDFARAYSGSILAGSAAGFTLGLGVADRIHLVPPAQLLVLVGTGFGAFQGAGWAHYARGRDNQVTGAGFIGVAAGGAGALTYALAGTVTTPVASSLILGTALGTWYAGMGADIAGIGQRDTLLACLAGSDAGLAITGALIGPLGVDPLRIAWGGVFGAIGAGLGATGAGFATARRREIEAAALAGTTAGVAAGVWLTPKLHLPAPALDAPVTLLGVQPFVAKRDGRTAPGITVTVQLD